jgi:BASS family bile acid:Na+ symporter
LAIAVFLATAMFSLGLDLSLRQIVEPLRNARMVGTALAANVLLVPLLGLGLASVIPMDAALRNGFLLYALCAGTEAGPKLVQMARGNAALAVGLLAVLIACTVVCVPIVITFVVADAQVSRGILLAKLAAAVALPIGVGLTLQARHPALAVRLSPPMHRAATLLLLLVFAQLLYVHFDAILAVQRSALLAGLILFAVSFSVAYALGGPERGDRRALAIMTFARNASIAMMIGGQVFAHEPKVLAMITVLTTLSIVLAVAAVAGFRRSPA